MQPIQDEIYNSAMKYLQNWDIQINFIHLFQNIDCIQD